MRVIDLLHNLIHQERLHGDDQVQIAKIKRAIFADTINLERNTMNNLSLFDHLRPYFAPAFAFTIFMIFIAGVFGFINYKKDEKTVTLLPPVSAAEVIANVQKVLKDADRVHYKIRLQTITPDGKPYEKEDNGGFNAITTGGDRVKEYWYDFKNGHTRFEDLKPEWVSATVEKRISDTEKILYGFSQARYVDGKRVFDSKEGIFLKTHWTQAKQELYPRNMPNINVGKNPEDQFQHILTQFKDRNPELESMEENGKQYHKLTINFPRDPTHIRIQQTEYILLIEKVTYRPFKEIKIFDEGKAREEYIYEEVSTDFKDEIFGPVPPKGYSLIENGKFVITSDYDPTLMRCGSEIMKLTYTHEKVYDQVCPEGTFGVYEIINAEWSNGKASAEIAGHGFPGLFGRIETLGLQLDIDFKLHKSKQTFKTREEAQKAKNVEYSELKKTPGGFLETDPSVEGTFVKFKLEVFDKKTGKKIEDIFLVPDGVQVRNDVG